MPTLPLVTSAIKLAPLGLVSLFMASWLDGDEDAKSEPEDEGEFGMEDDFGANEFEEDFGGFEDTAVEEDSILELEERIDDLENKIADVSSTANTVRSENEQLTKKMGEVQENVRKLLEIYEMVTRGVNPFVDDMNGSNRSGSKSDGFGLFEESGEIGNDDKVQEEQFDASEEEGVFENEQLAREDENVPDNVIEDVMEDFEVDQREVAEDETEGGTSFEELKEEYESAEWGDAEGTREASELEDSVKEQETGSTTSEESDETESSKEGFQFDKTASTINEGTSLESPPSGYLVDVVVLEWMDYMLTEFDARNTVRSINYYQRIGWIGDDMRDYLIEVVMGLSDSQYLYRDEFGTTELTISDHMKSLEYIEELSSGSLDKKIAKRLDTLPR